MPVRKVLVLSSDMPQSSLYSGNVVMALGNIQTWLQMKALEIWRAKGEQGAEPEFRDEAHPVDVDGRRCTEFWGVFPDDEVAKATFEAAVAEKVLLRTAGDYHLAAEGIWHEIRLNGSELIRGDHLSIGVIFNNLTGKNFAPENHQSWKTQTHEEYLQFMEHQFGVSLSDGVLELAVLDMPAMQSHKMAQVEHDRSDVATIVTIDGVGYSPLALQNKKEFEESYNVAVSRGFEGTYDDFCDRAIDFGSDSANGDLKDFVNSVASLERKLTVSLSDVAEATFDLSDLMKTAFDQTGMPMEVSFDYLHYGAWAERAQENDRPRLALLCRAAWQRELFWNADGRSDELAKNAREILDQYGPEWERLASMARKADSGFYYGTIKANEGERGMLEGLGITLGDYNEKTGEFYAEVDHAAYDRLMQFPADFKPTLYFRSNTLLSSDTPEEEFTVDQLKAEKAFCEWWLNGPCRAEREVTKPSKITDLEINLYQVSKLLAERTAEPTRASSNDTAPAVELS